MYFSKNNDSSFFLSSSNIKIVIKCKKIRKIAEEDRILFYLKKIQIKLNYYLFFLLLKWVQRVS